MLSDQFAFGMREVLLLSNEIDKTALFKGQFIHGDFSSAQKEYWSTARDRAGRAYPILFWSEVQKEFFVRNKITRQRKIVIGAPFCHLTKFLSNIGYPAVRIKRRLLYFPSHSHMGIRLSTLNEDLFRSQVKIFRDFGFDPTETTVCLFWLDYIDPEIRQHYLRLGFEVTCVGYKGNQVQESPSSDQGGRVTFLLELYDLIQSHETIITDSLDTSFLYAALLSKSVIYLSDTLRLRDLNQKDSTQEFNHHSWNYGNLLHPKTFYSSSDGNHEARDVARQYLGLNYCDSLLFWIKDDKHALKSKALEGALVEKLEKRIMSITGSERE